MRYALYFTSHSFFQDFLSDFSLLDMIELPEIGECSIYSKLICHQGSPSSTIPDTLAAELLDVFIQYSRCWVSTILSNNTVYDMLPVSSKVCRLPF